MHNGQLWREGRRQKAKTDGKNIPVWMWEEKGKETEMKKSSVDFMFVSEGAIAPTDLRWKNQSLQTQLLAYIASSI